MDVQLRRLEARLAERSITLDVTDEAKDLLAEHGYDPAYGARPLKRVIRRELEDRIAKMLLAGDLTDGSPVRVDASGEDLEISAAAGAAL